MKTKPTVYFVTAIGTDSGKTLVSAILCKALQANYWKPVQSGASEGTDSDTVRRLVNSPDFVTYPEHSLLHAPLSPHHAAALEQKNIQLNDLELPGTGNKPLVVEGAGGILVPLNFTPEFLIQKCADWDAKIILVSNHYLGSINHTLLTINALKNMGLSITGLVFNGNPYPEAESVIEPAAGCPVVLRLPVLEQVDSFTVQSMANRVCLPQ